MTARIALLALLLMTALLLSALTSAAHATVCVGAGGHDDLICIG